MVKIARWKAYLNRIYYDISHPAAFSSYRKLNNIVKKEGKFTIPPNKIRQFLESQDIYSLTHHAKNKFKRLKIICPKKGYMVDFDCGYLPREFVKDNENFYIFLLGCDCLSRYVVARVVKNTTGMVVSNAMSEILDEFETKHKIRIVRSDAGAEFISSITRKLLKNRQIKHIITQSDAKASFAEANIKFVKRLIFSYMNVKHTTKWISVFQKIIRNRNRTFNRNLNTTPENAWNNVSSTQLWKHQFSPKAKNEKKKKKILPKSSDEPKFKYDINQYVRILAKKTTFSRFYHDTYIEEVFVIIQRKKIGQHKLYQIKDVNDSIIKSFLYEQQLTSANVKEKKFEIEKIMKERVVKGHKQSLVLFHGYKKPSWIYNTEIHKIGPRGKKQ